MTVFEFQGINIALTRLKDEKYAIGGCLFPTQIQENSIGKIVMKAA